jgi:hypothetical protein
MFRSSSARTSQSHDKPTWGTTSFNRANVIKTLDTDAGESSMLDHILRSFHKVKSEVCCFRKLLSDYGLRPEDPTPSTKHCEYDGKENGQKPKPRYQRQEKCVGTSTKGTTKDKTSRPAPSFVPVKHEISSDYESEDNECSNMASVEKGPPQRINYRAINRNERTVLQLHAVLLLEQVAVS